MYYCNSTTQQPHIQHNSQVNIATEQVCVDVTESVCIAAAKPCYGATNSNTCMVELEDISYKNSEYHTTETNNGENTRDNNNKVIVTENDGGHVTETNNGECPTESSLLLELLHNKNL